MIKMQFLTWRIPGWNAVFGMLMLFFLVGCLSENTVVPIYAYPSFEKTRVRQYCKALYFPPYVEYIAPSRKRKVTSIESRSRGLLAIFADGRSYRVPLQTDLPSGQVFYCNYRSEPTPCVSDQDWDTRCLKDRPYRPGLFRY
jgi:hypothetical protein